MSAIAEILGDRQFSQAGKLEATYHFELKDLPHCPTIKVEILRGPGPEGNSYWYRVSHHIKTPPQAGAHVPSSTTARTEEAALVQAISDLTQDYQNAIRLGHTPDARWLEENPHF